VNHLNKNSGKASPKKYLNVMPKEKVPVEENDISVEGASMKEKEKLEKTKKKPTGSEKFHEERREEAIQFIRES